MNVRPSIALSRLSASGNPELLLMHYRYNGHDVYALPGGNPDRGETLHQTLERELMEELGVSVVVEDELLVGGEVLIPERKEDTLHLVFSGEIIAGNPILNPAETTAVAVAWKPANELPDLNLYPNVGSYLQRWLVVYAQPAGYVGPIIQPFF